MRYLLLLLLLTGCSIAPKPTPLPPTPIETKNQEKDKYITRVEDIVSDSASALTAVVPVLAQGNVRGLVEAQVTRLSGISKPTVPKVEEYKRVIAQNDTKAVEKDKKEAAKVDEETTALYAMVEQRDYELAEAHTRADAEFKQKVLWRYSTVGLAVFIAGLLALAFSPFKKSAGIVMLGGMTAMASAWIFESTWFTWIVAVAVGVSVIGIAISIYKAGKPEATDKTDQSK
jgi:lipopolysaccharide export LptBFGC system permease protein LptF